jgi:hypothetical protein
MENTKTFETLELLNELTQLIYSINQGIEDSASEITKKNLAVAGLHISEKIMALAEQFKNV